MATTETFQSKYRRENRNTGTRERRRVFEADGSERASTATSGVSITVGSRSYGRDRNTNDRTDSPSTVTQRMNRLNLKDDNKDGSDKEEDKPAINNDDEPTDEDNAKKSHKKERGGASANSARKRQARKNLREKRRSTGVVIMPGQPVVAANDEEAAVQENTAKNMDQSTPSNAATGANSNEELAKQVESYEQAIEEWKDELAKAKREIESLRNDNQRLKDENSALLRVVGSLSGTGHSRK